MALAIFIRNHAGLPAFSKIIQPASSIPSVKTFTQLLVERKPQRKLFRNRQFISIIKRGVGKDHSKLWTIEKGVSIGLLGIIPTTILYPANVMLDDIMAVLVVIHMFWGLEACLVDYVRPIIFGKFIPKLAVFLLYLITAATLGGLINYNHNYLGISCTLHKVWKLPTAQKT